MIKRETMLRTAELLREEYRRECEGFHWEPAAVGGAEERYVTLMEGGAPTRLLFYTPLGASSETLPLHISLHGGAFIRGSADFDDHFCRKTANEGRCRVINVDFRLAPEFRFPDSVEECYRVLVWAAAQASAACCSTVPSST